MPTQWNTFPVEFKGGLISNMSPLQQGLNAIGSATILQNMEVDRQGGYTKIRGYEKFSTTQVPGYGKIEAMHVVSGGRVVVARKVNQDAIDAIGTLSAGDINHTAYYFGTGTTWTHIATTADTGGGKASKAMFNFSGDDKVVFVDGQDYPGIYNTNGNSMSFLTAASPNINTDVQGAELVVVFKETTFYSKGSQIYFTAPNSVDNFSTGAGAGSLFVGNDVTGMVVFRDQLIIFTNDSIKRLTGNTSSDFQITPITNKIGCINSDTIQEFGGDIMYLSPDGIRLLSATDRIGDFGLDVASDKINKDSDDFLRSTPIYSSLILREKGQYRIFAYVESIDDEVAQGLVATKFQAQGAGGIEWSSTKGIKAYIADSIYAGTAEAIMFANEDGYVYELEKTNAFDGDNIETILETPYMPITDSEKRKTAYKLSLYTDPTGQMSLKFRLLFNLDSGDDTRILQPNEIEIGSLSGGGGIFVYGAATSLYGGTGTDAAKFGSKVKRIYNENLIGSFHTVAMRITSNDTNPPFTLDTAVLQYRENDRQ